MRSSDILKTLSFLTIILIGILLMSGCGEFGIQGPRQNVDDTPPDIEELKSNQDVKGLIKALGYKSEDYLIPNNAAFALVEIGEPAVEPLIEALKNENSQVRGRAAFALGGIGDIRAVEPLIEALNDTSIIRSNAAAALGKIGDARAVEPLIKVLDDEDETVQLNVTDALVKIGEPSVEPLIEALKNENSQVRNIAVDSLIKIGDTRAIEPLIGVLNKYDDKNMAEDFLNCGNVQLEEAARHWAASKGYVIQPAGSGGPSWGSS